MSASPKREDVRRRLEERYRRLAEARGKRPAAAILARFNEIDGGTQSGVVSIELFTTVIPLIILGFGYFSGFAKDASPGILLIRELGLQYPLSDRVREAFGTSAGLRSSWTIIGVAGFLVWGIPMSITIAGIFAGAWRRERPEDPCRYECRHEQQHAHRTGVIAAEGDPFTKADHRQVYDEPRGAPQQPPAQPELLTAWLVAGFGCL